MIESLRIAASVTTPLSLLGLIAALCYFGYSRRLKGQAALLQALPEHERARAIDQYLTRYRIDASNLTRDQKSALIVSEMEKRFRIASIMIVTSAIVFVACFAISAYAYVKGASPSTPDVEGQTTQATQGPNSPAIDLHGAKAGGDINVTVTPPENTKVEEILSRGLPQDEHPAIDLGRPIQGQLRLFPEDEVTVVGSTGKLRRVWFGKTWEDFRPQQTYVVWGREGEEVIPKFEGDGMLKLRIRYTRYRDKHRSPHGPSAPGAPIERK